MLQGSLIMVSDSAAELSLTTCTVVFEAAAQMELKNPFMKLTNNTFRGNGSILMGSGKELIGLEVAEIILNTFEGVRLVCGKIASDSEVQLRNNIGTNLQLRKMAPFLRVQPLMV